MHPYLVPHLVHDLCNHALRDLAEAHDVMVAINQDLGLYHRLVPVVEPCCLCVCACVCMCVCVRVCVYVCARLEWVHSCMAG